MKRKALSLLLGLGLIATGSVAVANVVETNTQYEASIEEQSVDSYQNMPTNVDYFIYYTLPIGSDQLTTSVNITGLEAGNDSYDRNFKLELIEYTGSTSSTHLITSFTTPTSGTEYVASNTTTFIFDFVNYSYELKLSVENETTSTWTEVAQTPVTETQNLYEPTLVDAYAVTTPTSYDDNTQLPGSDGKIKYYVVIDNPSNINYSINITLKDSSGVYVADTVFTNTTATTTGYVEFTGLEPDTYQITVSGSGVGNLPTGITYVNVLPTIGAPTGYFNATATNAAAPGLNGQINTCGAVSDPGTSTTSKVQTSINGGTSWEDACYVYNKQPGTYTVQGRIEYETSGGSTRYVDLGTKSVTIGTGAYVAPEATVSLSSTNTSSPTATDGTISGTVQWTKNYYNNATIELSLDNSNWVDITTGFTGLSAGTYTVYHRIRWNDGVNSQDNYVTNSSPITVTVGADAWNAPSISLSATSINAPTPTSTGEVSGDVIINSDPSNGAMQTKEYVSISTTNGIYDYQEVTGIRTLDNLAIGTTVYVTGKVEYDHDNNAATAMLTTTTATQTLTIENQPWVLPQFTVVPNAVPAGTNTGRITTTITKTTGDLQALTSMSLVLKDVNGNVIETQVIDQTDFTGNIATVNFNTVLPTGNYVVDMSFNYNLAGPGMGEQTYPITVSVPIAVSSLTRPTYTLNNLSVTNQSADGVNDGSVSFSYTLVDAANVIVAGGIDINLMKWTQIGGITTPGDTSDDTYEWQVYNTQTGFDLVDTYNLGTLDDGYYKFNFTIEADPDGTGTAYSPFTYTWNTNARFAVGRDWNYPMSVNTSLARVTEHTMDVNTTIETFDIVYDLTLNNPDVLPYEVEVELWNVGTTGAGDDVLSQTKTLSQATTSVTFEDVAPGNYQLRISQTSGQSIASLPTTVDIDTQTTSSVYRNPYLANPATDQAFTATTYTSGGVTYGEIEATLFVQNPDNRNYQFDFIIYDLTTNSFVVNDTYTNNHDADNGAEIHYSYAGGLDTTHTYAIVIDNVSGVWVEGVNMSYQLLEPSDWTTAMNNDSVSVGAIAGYSTLVGLIALALIATPTYIVIRRRVK